MKNWGKTQIYDFESGEIASKIKLNVIYLPLIIATIVIIFVVVLQEKWEKMNSGIEDENDTEIVTERAKP